jgi:hypothetical protein
MTTEEIALRIQAHLRRFEHDPEINERDPVYNMGPYYGTEACASGRWVHVTYVSYQGPLVLNEARAEAYLKWLDAGNVGKHHRISQHTDTPNA